VVWNVWDSVLPVPRSWAHATPPMKVWPASISEKDFGV
jgi:hypothetical protein